MNEYAQQEAFKKIYDIESEGERWGFLIKECLTWASRELDRGTRKFFYEKTETRKYNCPAKPYTDLYFDWPLLSLTTLTNGNGSTISSSNYLLYPDSNNEPFFWLELDDSSGVVWEYSTTKQQAIQVLGEWGWHEEYYAAWETSGALVAGGGINDTATTLTPDGSLGKFDFQMMLKIESEQVYVTDKTATTLTIERAKNGTTAAAHAADTAISIYYPQHDVRMNCMRLAFWRYKQQQASILESSGLAELVTWEVPSAMPRDVVKWMKRFRMP